MPQTAKPTQVTWLARGMLGLVQECQLWAFLPSSVLVTRNQPWWECLHSRNGHMLVTRAFPWEWLISIGQDTTVASTGTHLSLAFMQDFGSTLVWLSASYVPDILCLGGWRELFLVLPPSSHLRSFYFLPLFIFLGIWALLLSVLMNLGHASDHSTFFGVGRGVSFQHTP